MDNGPDFIIIGAMKCATSTIHDQLAHLPGISMSEPKEPNFFSDQENLERGIGWYQSLFAQMPSGDLKGESSTHYSKLPTYPQCVSRLHKHVPNAQFIYVMRDTIDRVVSQYIHEWSQRVIEDGCTIDEAIRRYPILIEYSKYAKQLEPYVELFGIEAVLPVFFERWMVDPQDELERIAGHIGYSGEVLWHDDQAKNVSSQRQRRSPMLDALLDIGVVKQARRLLLPESIRSVIRSRWTMNERPVLSEESVAYLHSQIDPDLKILGGWLGIELSCATFKEQVRANHAPQWQKNGSGATHGS